MKNSEDMERFFKDVASLYVEREGEGYQKELAEIAKENQQKFTMSLDKKVKNKITGIKRRKLLYKIMPVAAAVFIFVYYFATQPSEMKTNEETTDIPHMAAEQAEFTLLASDLPMGYQLTGEDRDQGKIIYYIDTDTRNSIVLIAEQKQSLEKSGFQEILINDTKAYVLVKKDYSVLTYEKENLLFTLTSPYDYRDLIELSENLI